MSVIFFDFDSTVISHETLQELLKNRLEKDAVLINEVKRITDEGIQGKISFADSLQARLTIAAPTRDDAIQFGKNGVAMITPGMKELIGNLHAQNIQVGILSGAPIEAILPVAKDLAIPEEMVFGIRLLWNSKGEFERIDPQDPFSRSKVEGFRSIRRNFASPILCVGDGATDYALLKAHLVDHFILFTQYIRCTGILEQGVPEAKNVKELEIKLKELLENGSE